MIKSFEGLRGIAALFIVVHHMFCAWPHPLSANALHEHRRSVITDRNKQA